MKRDCGDGELIPTKWSVAWYHGISAHEFEEFFKSLAEAEQKLEQLVEQLATTIGSDVRLYACDKQGYANCIRYWSQSQGYVKDRRAELK